MMTSCLTTSGTLAISLRESRMMLDRILMQTGLPYGFNPAVRESILSSEALHLGGFAHLLEILPTLTAARADAITLSDAADGTLVANCGGQHAWVVAQGLLDVMIESARLGGPMVLHVQEVAYPAELAVLTVLARRHGVRVALRAASGSAQPELAVTQLGVPPKHLLDPLLWNIVRTGLPVEAGLWWKLYRLALGALAPDTVVSRRHAGANYVDDQGRVVGRKNDDDTDFSLLQEVIPGKA